MTVLRIATRSSAQARAQSEHVGALISRTQPHVEVEYVYVDTRGDVNATTPLHQMGGQGVFVKEVQHAVLDGRADIAVHSAKDLPSQKADGLIIGAIGERRTPNDALVGATLESLAQGATVATGSVRRRAQLKRVRPDFQFVDLRGNIQTRLSKIPEGGAIVMAVAAMEILGITDQITQVLPLDLAVPMVGQGSVAVECRESDTDTLAVLSRIDHAQSRRAVEAERAFLAILGAGCSVPVGAHLSTDGVFRAFMATDSGDDCVQLEGFIGDSDDHILIGALMARQCSQRLANG
jgi:hydroxymethylbilane synthase